MKTKILEKKIVYKGKHPYSTNLYGLWVQKGKEKFWRTYAQVRDGLAVLPITKENKILMIREYKAIFKDYFWQIPTGYLDDNISVIHNSKTELEEETGYTAKKFRKVLAFHPSMGSMKQTCILVLAEGAKKSKERHPENREDIGIAKEFTIKEAIRMIEHGKIRHDSTIMGIYYAASKFGKE